MVTRQRRYQKVDRSYSRRSVKDDTRRLEEELYETEVPPFGTTFGEKPMGELPSSVFEDVEPAASDATPVGPTLVEHDRETDERLTAERHAREPHPTPGQVGMIERMVQGLRRLLGLR